MPDAGRPLRLNPYLLAVLAVAGATAVRLALAPLIGHHLPFVTYYVAVAIVAFYGTLDAALLATVAGALIGTFFFGAAILSAPAVPVR